MHHGLNRKQTPVPNLPPGGCPTCSRANPKQSTLDSTTLFLETVSCSLKLSRINNNSLIRLKKEWGVCAHCRPSTGGCWLPNTCVQGYGLTETCAASFIANPFDFGQKGTVGPPLAHTELRLEPVPEMG